MAVDPGVEFAVLLNGVLLFLGLLAYGYWQRVRTERSDSPEDSVEEWYESAASLAHEVQQLVEPSNAPVTHDDLQRQLLPLSNRLQGHARAAPSGVDEQSIKDLYNLGMDCYRLGIEHTRSEAARTGVFIEDKLEEVRASAEEFEMAISIRTNRSE